MKLLTVIAFFALSITAAFGQQRAPTIDDLGSLKLRVDKKTLEVDVHYPNYRMGGGTGPTRPIRDCFVLDILDSDNNISLATKQQIAEELLVSQGFGGDHDEYTELSSSVVREKVVFKILPQNFYMTTFLAKTKSGESLKSVLDRIMPPTRMSNRPARVNLLYVRDCRL